MRSMSIILLSLVYLYPCMAQQDSLVFKDNSYLVGEIKSMDRGALVMETSFSKDDFKIEWDEVEEVYTASLFLLSTTDGRRLYGSLTASVPDRNLVVQLLDSSEVRLPLEDVVYIKSVDQGFSDRFYAGIDLGFTLTKARNQRQFSFRSRAGYLAERWSVDYTLNNIISSQDEVEDIRRGDGNITFKYVLPREWFVVAQNDFLYNTEQLLDLRSNTMLGFGRYLIRTNFMYWNAYTGVSFNNEDYEGEGNDRQSGESWLGSELNLYDIEDFSLLTNVIVYPSLTESGRVRVDYRIDLKYDLPLDFYIKTGFTLNYDNQPVAGAATSDYIWQTTFGWSW